MLTRRPGANYRNIYGFQQPAAVDIPDDGFAEERARKGIPKPRHDPKPKRIDHLAGMPPGTHDVLRFFCAYQDDRTDGDEDRRYVLHFFLRDGTVEVKECKTEGVQPFPNLLNRSKLPKDTFFNPDTPMYDANQPKAVSWEDLRVWFDDHGLGPQFTILSCDRTTELFYQRKGIAQNPCRSRRTRGRPFRKRCLPLAVSGRKMTCTPWG